MNHRKNGKPNDPRGHSIRVYSDIFDSPAFKALSPHDVMAYLALLRELKGYNNGDLSLPLSRAKECGINHHVTLARSLRALCAVGLIAVTRKGGSTKGGQRLPTLYRMTDRECYDIPKKGLEAMHATNEWRTVATPEQGRERIQATETAVKNEAAKLKTLGHRVTVTTSPRDMVGALTTTPRDTWFSRPLHPVTHGKKGANLELARVSSRFDPEQENQSHRTPRVPPLYIAIPTGDTAAGEPTNEDAKTAAAQREQHSVDSQIGQGRYVRLMARPKRLFTRLLEGQHQGDDDQGMQLAQAVVQRAAQAAGKAVVP